MSVSLDVALSLDDLDGPVIGYVRELPETTTEMRRLADREDEILARINVLRGELRSVRQVAHTRAIAHWSPEEIKAAVALAVRE